MKSVLFLDEFFVINFVMDLIVVCVVAKCFAPELNRRYKLSAAFCGSILSCVYVVFGGNGLIWQLVFHVLTGLVMAICLKNIKLFFALNVACAILAGVMNYVYFSGIFVRLIRSCLKNPMAVFAIATTISFFVVNVLVGKFLTFRDSCKAKIYKVSIILNNKNVQVEALLDTGNTLTEPISGKPVHVMEEHYVNELVGEKELTDLNLRLIPFHSIGKNNGIITGIIADSMVIHKEPDIYVEKPVIGIYKGSLSQGNSYSMLLNSSLR